MTTDSGAEPIPHPSLTYSTYLHIDEMLALQTPRSARQQTESHGTPAVHAEHDEMLFIIIHQVYELWFKQMLHEVDYLQEKLRAADTPRVLHTLRRLLTILKTVVSQIDVLETMTPLEFNSFRSFLESASGFQSLQFRAMEFAMGHKRPSMIHHFAHDPGMSERLRARIEAPTLWDAFLAYLHALGYSVPPADLQRDVTQPIVPSSALQELLVTIYRTDAQTSALCELLVDWDEGLQEWRYRHVKMVERTIGNKRGTGGSTGVGYLRTTIEPLFPDLWAIRSRL